MKKILMILLAFAFLVSCSADRSEPDENVRWIDVYYRDDGDKILSSEQRAISAEENITALIRTSVEYMMEEPVSNGLAPVLPNGTKIIGVNFDHGVAKINFSNEYYGLDGFEKTVAEYAILMTLSNFWNVHSAEISVEGQIITPEFSQKDIVTEIPKGQG